MTPENDADNRPYVALESDVLDDNIRARRRALFDEQAGWCDRLGSPFTARLCRVLGRVLDDRTATGRRVLDWPETAGSALDAVPLRLAGALNALVLAGGAPALAALYPPNPLPGESTLAEAVAATLQTHDKTIVAFLDHPPQTNEVARAALIYAGLMTLAEVHDVPMELVEIGSSAGLNLLLARFAYDLGGRRCGDPASPVHLSPTWTGLAPTGPQPRIVAGKGCDINPLDVLDEASRTRLLAYVWPDQAARLVRLRAALALALDSPPEVAESDAADHVDKYFSGPGTPGRMRVLVHSITLQYLPDATRELIARRMKAAGRGATAAAPVARVSFEQGGQGAELIVESWPGGIRRRLATGDAHGRAVVWLGGGLHAERQ